MLALLLIADSLFPEPSPQEEWPTYLLLIGMGTPFVLPWSWFRTPAMRNVLIGWIALVAVAFTIRSIQMLLYWYPRRELVHWLIMQALVFMLVAPFWLALAAAWRRRSGT
jgi:hypothetical protein